MAKKAILYDASRCSACKGCQVACKCWNGLPSPLEKNSQEWSGSLQNPPDLNPDTRLIMTFREADNDTLWGIDWAFGRRSCMHCADAGCVRACPAGCLTKDDETGLTIFDPEKCIGCQYCRSACPFDVPRHTNVNAVGGGIRINKCTGCHDRVVHGLAPACVTTCQPGALDFGDRDDMLRIAEERMKILHEQGFTEARVYGKDEVGGTHSIYVLKYGLDMYELPENPQIADLVHGAEIVKPVAAAAAAALVAGLGISYATGIGYKVPNWHYDESAHDVIDDDTGSVVKHIDREAGER